MDGQVIGINSAIVTRQQRATTASASPSRSTWPANVADMLIKDGKVHYARIGIELEPLTPALARQLGLDARTKGVLVGDVVPGSPADKAGLKAGRRDHRLRRREGRQTCSSFRLKVATSEVAKPYELVYFRDGKERTTTIVPARRPRRSSSTSSETAKSSDEAEAPSPPRRRSTTSAWKSSR